MDAMVSFTVIIPTRDRADTLYYALRTVTRQDYPNLRILVSDNASTDDTARVVAEVSDERVSYLKTAERLSMAHNYEFALSHVHDGWVTILGDDDALLPGALWRVNEVIQHSGCQLVASRLCSYNWPGWRGRDPAVPPSFLETRQQAAASAALWAGSDVRLSVPLTAGYEVRDAREWLRAMLGGYVYHNELPALYTGGFASIALLERARDERGRLYRSMFPDVYAAIALSWLAGRYAAMQEPVAVAGASAHSTGCSQYGLSALRGPIDMFYSENNLPCHPRLAAGRVVSLPLTYYESYLQAEVIHQNALSVTLEEQLVIAWLDQGGSAEEQTYISSVASLNGLDPQNIVEKAARHRGTRRRHRMRRDQALRARRIVPGAYGATNVLEAACVCAAILGEAARKPTRRSSYSTPPTVGQRNRSVKDKMSVRS